MKSQQQANPSLGLPQSPKLLSGAVTVMRSKGSNMDKTTERLPFRVEIAAAGDLPEVARLRAQAYGRHLPGLGAVLQTPEPADYEKGCEVFIARSKFDGAVLGTLRTHSNILKPVPLEASIELPDYLKGSLMVETTRLSVLGGEGSSLVRNTLFKALHAYCLEQGVDWMLAAGRRPVDRIYDSLLFQDVNDKGVYYPMAHAAGVPHRVMQFSPELAQDIWAAHQHPLYRFVFETHHPDIDLSAAANLAGLRRSRRATVPAAPGLPVTQPVPVPMTAGAQPRWASFGLRLVA